MSRGNLIRVAISAVLLTSLLNLTPASAVTPGDGCQRVGQTSIVGGKKYFCVAHKDSKSWITWIWSKGVPFPESPSKKLTVRSIASAALKSWYEKQPIRADKIEAIIDPALDPTIRDLFLIYAEDAFRFWGEDFLPDATMFIGAATPWYVKEQCDFFKRLKDPVLDYGACIKRSPSEIASGSGWPNQEPNQLNANGAVFGPITILNEPKTFYTTPLYIFLSSLEIKPNLNISAVVQHELAHIVQWNSYGNGGTGSQRAEYFQLKAWATNLNWKLVMNPTLWSEGSAFFFGNSLGELRNPGNIERDLGVQALNYLSSRSKDIDYLISEPFPFIGPNMTPAQNEEKNDFYSRRYVVGGLMTELMCAKFGIAKCLDFNKAVGAGAFDPDATFQSTFEKHFLTSWAAFAKATNSYVNDLVNKKPTPLKKYFPGLE
jgi:hypothetical protein